MKTYYIRKSASTYASALIQANSAEEARDIATAADINDMYEETEYYEIDYLVEIGPQEASEYDIPTLKQTQQGYELWKQ